MGAFGHQHNEHINVIRSRSIIRRGARLGFVFLLDLGPPRLCCFPGKLPSLLWRESCHACFSALAGGCLSALSAHLTHDFGNKVTSHRFILWGMSIARHFLGIDTYSLICDTQCHLR
jgi:hypothetical protein